MDITNERKTSLIRRIAEMFKAGRQIVSVQKYLSYCGWNDDESRYIIKQALKIADNGTPAKLKYLGYGDSDTHYECPFCGEKYSGWWFVQEKIKLGEVFICEQCGNKLEAPR